MGIIFEEVSSVFDATKKRNLEIIKAMLGEVEVNFAFTHPRQKMQSFISTCKETATTIGLIPGKEISFSHDDLSDPQNLFILHWFNSLTRQEYSTFNQVVTMETFKQFLETKEYNSKVTKKRISDLKDRYQNDLYLRRIDFQCPGITKKNVQCKNPNWCSVRHSAYLRPDVFYSQEIIDRVYTDIEDTITEDEIFSFTPNTPQAIEDLTQALDDSNIKVVKLERLPII